MCRNIKSLANLDPPASEDKVRAAAVQFVRMLSGTNRPSHANEPAFDRAVDEVTAAASHLLHSLRTSALPRNREEESRKAQERSRKRFPPDTRVVTAPAEPSAQQTASNNLPGRT